MPPSRFAFVVPRYGPEIVGGAETLARALAENLAPCHEVTILTTCALDHHSWRNVLPPGEDPSHTSLRLQRFPVSPREVGRFLAIQERLSAGMALSVDEEIEWVAGSVNSEPLYEHLADEHERYDAIFFLPYLFGTTLVGSQAVPEKSVLIPCLHDEPFAYTRLVRHLFRSVRGVLFNSEPERALAEHLFGGVDAAVVGMGFDAPEPLGPEVDRFRAAHGVAGDYVLYFGRKEEGKNLPLLLECFEACRRAGEDVSLVVAGDGRLDPALRSRGVIDLARLEQGEKRAACAGALAVCQPSLNESFSIVLMESWLEGTPVLVHSAGAVTRHHVTEANGGLHFASPAEFVACVRHVRQHPDDARALGRSGRAYVLARYSWADVRDRFERGVAAIFSGGDQGTVPGQEGTLP